MKKKIWGGLIGLFILIFAIPAFPLTPYDDFSGAFLDKRKWADGEFVREIVGGKLVSKLAAPNSNDTYGTNVGIGRTFRFANNGLNFSNPSSVNSIQADVSVLEAIHTNPTWDTRAMLAGRWYNDGGTGTQGGGDIWAAVSLGAVSLPGGTVGIVARWELTREMNLDGTAWTNIANGYIPISVSLGATYNLYIGYDDVAKQFTFKVGNQTKIFGIPDGLPARVGDANLPFKALRTRVWLQNSTESGYIFATFANVYSNGTLYDNFSLPNIDQTKWSTYEYVREISGGQLRTKVRSSSGSTSTIESRPSFNVDPSSINVIQTNITPKAYENCSGCLTTLGSRIYGRFFHDGTPGGGLTGDVAAQVGIGVDGNTLKGYWLVNRTNNEDSTSHTTLPGGLGIFNNTLITLGSTYPISLAWDGTTFTFNFGSETATYTPTGTVDPPNRPYKQLSSRMFLPNGREAGFEALFDDVVIDNFYVTSISPEQGSISSTNQYFTLNGGGFQPGSAVKLTNFALINQIQTSIDATNVTVSSLLDQITGTFDLSGALPGPWNVAVINPDGLSAALPNGFTVVNTTPPISVASPVGGTYNGPIRVALTAGEPADIYYKTSGSAFVLYSGPFTISSSPTTLQFYAKDIAEQIEPVKTEVYTIDGGLGGVVQVPPAPVPPAPGEPIWVTATFSNNTGQPIQTFQPDCFNTFFRVTDEDGNPLPPNCRVRAAYGIPEDVITIPAGGQFTVTCDLSEMYAPEVLTSADGGNAKTYNVAGIYSNYIQDPDLNPVTGECLVPPCYPLFTGAISSLQKTVTIQGNPIEKKQAEIIFDPSQWDIQWASVNGPPIAAQISGIDVGSLNPSSILLNGTVPIISGSAITQNGVLTVQFDRSLAVKSLGSVVAGSTVIPTVQGAIKDSSDVFYGNAPVNLVSNPGTLLVEADLQILGSGKDPIKVPVVGMEVRVYDKSRGSCVAQHGISWENYPAIWNLPCKPTGTDYTNAYGDAVILVPPGNYLVIGKYTKGSTTLYPGVSVGLITTGSVLRKYLLIR